MPEDIDAAYCLGSLIAKQGWVLLNGGRDAGIMDASAKGAAEHNGLTIGILPDDNCSKISSHIQIPIVTGMGNARNCINVLSSNIVVACAGGAGTISEVALAVKNNKPVILLNFDLRKAFNRYIKRDLIHFVKTPEEAIEKIKELLNPTLNT
jgi:hypothetical protein